MSVEELVGELEHSDDVGVAEIAAQELIEAEASAREVVRLLGHRAASVRLAGVLALGRMGGEGVREALEGRLGDASQPVREAACAALAAQGDARSAAAVRRLLRDERAGVREVAARSLGTFPEAETVSALRGALERETRDPATRRAVVESLVEVGRAEGAVRGSVLEVLARWVPREDDVVVQEVAAEGLAGLIGAAGYGELLPVFRKVPFSGRGHLATALSAYEDQSAGLARLVGELDHLPPDREKLAELGSDLTARALEGRLSRAYGRQAQIEAIKDRLRRRGPRGVVLVGPSGVGKTAVIHELARALAEEAVLVPTVVHEVTSGELLSGTRYLGDWQSRVKTLQDAIKAPRRGAWYLPDLNRLVDAGTTSHSDASFANMVAPDLERGDLVILGESTPEALRLGLDRSPGVRKLFWKIEIPEPGPEGALEIMEAVAEELIAEWAEREVTLVIPSGAVRQARDLADDYLVGMARPGRGVRLLREAVEDAANPRAEAEEGRGPRRVRVGPSEVVATLSRLTGVPQRLIDDEVELDLDEVRRFFSGRVLGQEPAVSAVVDLIGLIKTGLTDPTRPLGILFFVGPTGVGKTEMAKALAEYLFGGVEHLVRVDLGEYKEPQSHRRLVGDPMAVEPSARVGLLTAPVRERPFSVVLLDEVEKAHRNVFDLLLPLLAEGRLVDERGEVTDFRRTIVVMTSNLGCDPREGLHLGFGSEESGASSKVLRAMEEAFRPEFVNRIGKVVLFQSFSMEVRRRLIRREVQRVLRRRGLVRRDDVEVECDEAIIGFFLEQGFSERLGARPLKRRVEELLLTPVARALLKLGPRSAPAVIRLEVSEGRLVSQVIVEEDDGLDEEAALEAARSSARVRDPRRGRLLDLDDLEARIEELDQRLREYEVVVDAESLKARRSELMKAFTDPKTYAQGQQVSEIQSEIYAIGESLDTHERLNHQHQRLWELYERVLAHPRDQRLLQELLGRSEDMARRIEFAGYEASCTSSEERGDAYVVLTRVGEADAPEDPISLLTKMYQSYAQGKGFQARPVLESVTRAGWLRELTLRVEGNCAYGLLRGESGLHQWVYREAGKRAKQVAFVRVRVIPPADEDLQSDEVSRESRVAEEGEGVFLKPRHHLVLAHQAGWVALDGHSDRRRAEAEAEAQELLAARVAAARREPSDPGIVRRYVRSSQSTVRDLRTQVKDHLDRVLDGQLDAFVLPTSFGASRAEESGGAELASESRGA